MLQIALQGTEGAAWPMSDGLCCIGKKCLGVSWETKSQVDNCNPSEGSSYSYWLSCKTSFAQLCQRSNDM